MTTKTTTNTCHTWPRRDKETWVSLIGALSLSLRILFFTYAVNKTLPFKFSLTLCESRRERESLNRELISLVSFTFPWFFLAYIFFDFNILELVRRITHWSVYAHIVFFMASLCCVCVCLCEIIERSKRKAISIEMLACVKLGVVKFLAEDIATITLMGKDVTFAVCSLTYANYIVLTIWAPLHIEPLDRQTGWLVILP